MCMRVYLPATLRVLDQAVRAAEIGPAPLQGFAVTPDLREWYASGDQEELEYVALMHAARASLRLLAADPTAPRRRVVIAADVPDDQVRHNSGFEEPTVVEVTAPVPLERVVSGHIDDPVAMVDVADAVNALAAADAGDQDAQFVVDGAEGHELQWFATQEFRYLEG
jgi:hypothetical protein